MRNDRRRHVRSNPDAFGAVLKVVGILGVGVLAFWGLNVHKIVSAPDSAFQPGGKYYDPTRHP